LPTGNARHIMIRLDKVRPYFKRYYVKTLVAHYDRVEGTPGANDNSAAVIQLIYSIQRLKSLKSAHNIQIILTDKEELLPGDPIVNQGAYQLAHLFRENKINNCIFFVFDMCGIGDTLISGKAGLQLLKSKYDSEPRYKKMYENMLYFSTYLSNLFLQFREGEFFNLNSLFSDNLGFLLNRYPALQISILPSHEAVKMKKDLFNITAEEWQKIYEKGMLSEEYKDFLNPLLPESWRNNHKISDTIDTLDSGAFEIIDEFIFELALFQIPFGETSQ
ncbi:MAG: M28 family peptidase, partial [Spirochaetaceae bacterium]|nr:M28 family peptidase [Spirochaetaceae bacterium]